MRHLILTALLAAAPFAVHAADDAGGAFGDLVRKPANAVCPFDGNPINATLPSVPMVGADQQEVMVGACSQACVNRLHTTFGEDMRRIASAAKSNTTLAKMSGTATPANPSAFGPPPAALPASPGSFGPPPSPTASATSGSFGPAPAPAATPGSFGPQSPVIADNGPKPAVVHAAPTTSSLGAEPAAKPKSKSEKPKKHDEPTSNERGDQSDERQRQKKAAQRRDRGDSSDDSSASTSEKKHKSSSKKSSKTDKVEESAPPASNSMETGSPVLGQ